MKRWLSILAALVALNAVADAPYIPVLDNSDRPYEEKPAPVFLCYLSDPSPAGLAARGAAWVAPVDPLPEYEGVEIVGSSVVNNNGVLSGFSVSSYAKLPYSWNVPITNLEAVITVDLTTTTITVDCGIWGCVGAKNSFTPYYVQRSKSVFCSYVSNNGGTWNVVNAYSGSPLSVGVSTLKVSFSTTDGYKWSKLVDGEFVVNNTYTSSNPPYVDSTLVAHIGNNRGQNNAFIYGTVDLNQSYLVRNGVLVWEGVRGAYRRVNGRGFGQ